MATPDNLARWGRPVDTRCSMSGCDSFCSLGHMLSACSKSLDRFKFRHDSVLSHLLNTINKNKKEEVTTFADLNGWRVNGGTVPPDLALTEQIPDLVIIDRSMSPAKVILLEQCLRTRPTLSKQLLTERQQGTRGSPLTWRREALLCPTCHWRSDAGGSSISATRWCWRQYAT